MFFVMLIAVVFVNATKRKRVDVENANDDQKLQLTNSRGETDQQNSASEYFSAEKSSNENRLNLVHPDAEERNEKDHFAENRLLNLPKPILKTLLIFLRPKEVVDLAQTCKGILLDIISIHRFQFLGVRGLVIPGIISEDLEHRYIRYFPKFKTVVLKPNTSESNVSDESKLTLIVVNANFITEFNNEVDKEQLDLENDELFLCKLTGRISYIIFGKLFARHTIHLSSRKAETRTVLLPKMPIQVYDEPEKHVVFCISHNQGVLYYIHVLNTSFDLQLRDAIGADNFDLNSQDFDFVSKSFFRHVKNDMFWNPLIQKLKRDQNLK